MLTPPKSILTIAAGAEDRTQSEGDPLANL
jgi:hypothetical protein